MLVNSAFQNMNIRQPRALLAILAMCLNIKVAGQSDIIVSGAL